MPQEQGHYAVNFSIIQEQEDQDPTDNFIPRPFSISDVIYARDHRYTESIYLAPEAYADSPYEIGNMYVITGDDMAAHSISVGVGVGSQVGAEVYGAIYKFDLESGAQTTLVAETETPEVYFDALNNFGDDKSMILQFPNPVVLPKDSAFLVVAGCEAGPTEVMFAANGESPAWTSWALFSPSFIGYMLVMPHVRLNFGPVVGIEESAAQALSIGQNFPNPFSDRSAFSYDLVQPSDVWIAVMDLRGKQVLSEYLGNKGSGKHMAFINGKSLAPGMYTYTLKTDYSTGTRKMIVSN
jgi:hypothetical protein